MNILGVSALYHDSAAALCQDGEIVAAVQEERFSRKKNDAAIPREAIQYCMAQLKGQKLDAVVYYDNPILTMDRWFGSCVLGEPDKDVFAKRFQDVFARRLWVRELVLKEIRKYTDKYIKFYICNHHMSHAASAFYPSPFEEAAIVTIDGVGEWATTSIGVGIGAHIYLLKQLMYPDSVGLLYSAFTYFCGFKVNSGEYKLMGLAAYGEPVYADLIKREIMDIKEDGSIKLNGKYFSFMKQDVMVGSEMESLFGVPRRKPEEPIGRIYIDIAASIQSVTEEIILKLARYAKALTGKNKLVLAGGSALNCVANGKILREGIFEDIWIQPAAGDAGGALGAALYAEYMLGEGKRKPNPQDSQKGSFLGSQYTRQEVEDFLLQNKYPYIWVDEREELYGKIADLVVEGKVIGLFQGRMEFGPRALGGRSIIADPRAGEMQSKLNLKIKFRESFRPFAPAVLREKARDIFALEAESPYMLITAQVKECSGMVKKVLPYEEIDLIQVVNEQRSALPAITHYDYSARIQTVDEGRNPFFYGVLNAFYRKTGCPVMINTSFNVRSEPIVCTLKDAYLCFMRTDMDVLVLENAILYKEEQKALVESEDWRKQYELD